MVSRGERALVRTLLACVLVLAGSACGLVGDDGDDSVDPPLTFDPQPVRMFTSGPATAPLMTLYEENAWVADEAGLTLVDLVEGGTLARVEPERPSLYESGQGPEDLFVAPPLLTQVDDVPVVLGAVAVRPRDVDGDPGVEVLAARADDGEVLWRLPLWPDAFSGGGTYVPPFETEVVHAYENRAVITLDGEEEGSIAVDLAEQEVLWELPVRVDAGWEDVVAGMGGSRPGRPVVGLRLADGEPIWDKPWEGGGFVRSAGRWLQVTGEQDRLIDMVTGETAYTGSRDGITGGSFCSLGEGGTAVVCASRLELVGLDVDTGDLLWRRYGFHRGEEAIVHAQYGDAVYVTTRHHEDPAVVDARTGKIIEPDPGVIADQVNSSVALVRPAYESVVQVHLPTDRME